MKEPLRHHPVVMQPSDSYKPVKCRVQHLKNTIMYGDLYNGTMRSPVIEGVRTFQDHDGCTYTLPELQTLAEADGYEILDLYDLEQLDQIAVGEKISTVDGWVERIN